MSSLTARQREAAQALRASVNGARGEHYWRALESFADDPRVHELFPQLRDMGASLDRRAFLKLMGASMAMAGLAACSGPPSDRIVPLLGRGDGAPPQRSLFYATAVAVAGEVAGILVETNEGRPTKIEGNPEHPLNAGATDAITQAMILELWDPDRSQTPYRKQAVASWDTFDGDAAVLRQTYGKDGSRLRVLSGRLHSTTAIDQAGQWLRRFPGSRWHIHEAIDDAAVMAGLDLAYGRPLRPRLDVSHARVILTLEADLLGDMPGKMKAARDFTANRDPTTGSMTRLYAVESSPTLTGANADHTFPMDASDIPGLVDALAAKLGVGLQSNPDLVFPALDAIVNDLKMHIGTSLVVAGRSLPAPVHACVAAINHALGNVGTSIHYLPVEDIESGAGTLAGLVADMHARKVDTLLILDGNPAYAAPAMLDFAGALKKVRQSIHFGLYRDETAALCDWHLPSLHPLEAWSDLRAADGTVSVQQPVISPLYAGRSLHALLGGIIGDVDNDDMARVMATWKLSGSAWDEALRRGSINTAVTPTVMLGAPRVAGTPSAMPSSQARSADAVDVVFRPDATLWDGRHANNGWLQELPRPLTRLTWHNAALVSPSLAAERKLANGDIVELRAGKRRLEIPIWIAPGQAPRTVALALGGGRWRAGQVGTGQGSNANALRHTDSPWFEAGVQMIATGRRRELASTQEHQAMNGRDIVRASTLDAFRDNPSFARGKPTPPSFYPDRSPGEYAWGMSIDLNACIGCNACTIACQSENNIPVVGEDQVRRGRQMHWIRVDRYYTGQPAAPRTFHQPVPCMHCEHAPCEVVCPVGATVHDSEGLNLQVYNRCVGTRFCANNCPYKVRRFNFLEFSEWASEQSKARRNPEVTVRSRGVMEKCTYCVQRIESAHIEADREGRRIADGEVVTACQAVCPTKAIVFGNVADDATAVARAKASPRSYALLEELNTRPRTTYLAAIRNPNPAIEGDA
ncbi:Fe-S-cluster-containing hydrogenase [Pinirhizobacter sp.]|uniref:Fe-S-cluster-containing hydrogenase n=1 Tax=Pinirhizobacter sp. TaxID=2950432 RepID=UPI002F400B4C